MAEEPVVVHAVSVIEQAGVAGVVGRCSCGKSSWNNTRREAWAYFRAEGCASPEAFQSGRHLRLVQPLGSDERGTGADLGATDGAGRDPNPNDSALEA